LLDLEKELSDENEKDSGSESKITQEIKQIVVESPSQSAAIAVHHHEPAHHEHHESRHPHQPEHSSQEHAHHHDSSISDHFLKITCVVGLIAWFVILILLSLLTQTNPFFIFLGLSPIIMTILVTYVLVDKYHMESGFLLVFPFIFTGILLLLGVAGLLGGLDYLTLSVVNIVCGILFESVLILQHAFIVHEHKRLHERKEDEKKEEAVHHVTETHIVTKEPDVHKVEIVSLKEEKTQHGSGDQEELLNKIRILLNSEEDVKKFVASMEDKAKALNAVVGRVYSVKHGGSESLRKKIRIDPEHYNGFNQLSDHHAVKRKVAALKLLKKIKETLIVLNNKEADVFDSTDLSSLVNLQRDSHGQDAIIEVLAKNDSDPVKTYHESALQFCEQAIEEIGSQQVASEVSKPKKKQPVRKKIKLSKAARKKIIRSLKSRKKRR
jgi:hypothetical protein